MTTIDESAVEPVSINLVQHRFNSSILNETKVVSFTVSAFCKGLCDFV